MTEKDKEAAAIAEKAMELQLELQSCYSGYYDAREIVDQCRNTIKDMSIALVLLEKNSDSSSAHDRVRELIQRTEHLLRTLKSSHR